MNKLYPEEKEEIKELLNNRLDIYYKYLNKYKKYNKSYAIKCGLNENYYEEQCEFYLHKIELIRKIKSKIDI